MTRILIADDRGQVRSALRLLLEQQPRTIVVREAETGDELLGFLRSDCADLVLLDWELSHTNFAHRTHRNAFASARHSAPTHLVAQIRTCCPGIVIVALSTLPESRRAALAAGVDAFISKGDPPEQLLAAVRDAASGPGPNARSAPIQKGVLECR